MKVDIIRDSESWLKEEITIKGWGDLRQLYDQCNNIDFRYNDITQTYEAILHDKGFK